MQVLVNGSAKELPADTTLRGLIELLGAAPEGIAVAVNGEVVPRREHADRVLAEGDKVEVIRAVGGG